MIVRDIVDCLNAYAPLSLQEDYDNAGLQIGSGDDELRGVLLCVDVTPAVVEEAVAKDCNMIVSHHPLIFKGLKHLGGNTFTERAVIAAVRHGLSVYCGHTNFDNAAGGVSAAMCTKLRLQNTSVLAPKEGLLRKIRVFVPESYAEAVRLAMFAAGAGNIGNYDCCSFNVDGCGSFRASTHAHPFVGKPGELHYEDEVCIEMAYPAFLEANIVGNMLEKHPYEEVAYDICQLSNPWSATGGGMLGDLPQPMSEKDFLDYIVQSFHLEHFKYAGTGRDVSKVAVCGGSGSFLITTARNMHADAFITADIKYHDYFLGESQLLLADIGHYESEMCVKEIFFDVISKKFPNIVPIFSEVNTNLIKFK